MIIAVILVLVFLTIAVLIVRELRRVLYAMQVHHLAKVTEAQARANCAPLSNAIVRHAAHE